MGLGKDTLIGLEVRGKYFAIGAPFLLAPERLCSTLGSFYPTCIAPIIKSLGKATPLFVHARSHPIPKGLQPYKGTHAYTKWFCQKSKGSLKRSKGSRDPSVQELPHEVYIVRSQAFPCNCISLYCKRPTVGANEPSVVKENSVQACNQKRARPALPSIS